MRRAAVIGYPVTHSLSPRLHGFWLKKYRIEGEYTAIEVTPDTLPEVLRGLGAKGFCGINVTVPHKETVIKFLDSIDEAARAIGAVNTITVRGGKLKGTNTDVYGFIENLRQNGFPRAKNKAVVLGAGGAARAVVKALTDEKFAKIMLVNRTTAKAEAIAKNSTGVEVMDWKDRAKTLSDTDLLVNTTTLGMQGKEPLALDLSTLPRQVVVNDLVYTPLITPLLAEAKARGNKTVDGLGMLIHQAVPAFEAWFGIRPVVDDDVRKQVLGD